MSIVDLGPEFTAPIGPEDPTPLPPIHPEEWKLHSVGACRQSEFDGFFSTTHSNRRNVNKAKAVCQTCPVFDACRRVVDHLERNTEQDHQMGGVWAGETPGGRRARRQAERKLAQAS